MDHGPHGNNRTVVGESAEIKLAKCGGKQEKRGELTGTVKDAQGHTAWTISGGYMSSVSILQNSQTHTGQNSQNVWETIRGTLLEHQQLKISSP